MILKHSVRINKIQRLKYCTKITLNNKIYSSTILLPKTDFPLRLENDKLIDRDKNIYTVGKFENLYDWQRSHLSEPEFVLHDGPPYANGKLHMGHAINKILKDIILRCHILKGNKVHYVPGWDCHGLPIETKAVSNSNSLSDIELRNKAKNFATKTINEQKKGFQSWGVLGDWKHPYTTYNVDYVKMQLRQFLKLYEKNLIYRDIKPVFWSPSSRTALAEAELEYNEAHKSPSLYLQIEIKDVPKIQSLKGKSVYGIIWTTTPWTLPANTAICYNDSLQYSIVKKADSNSEIIYIVASELLSSLSNILNWQFEVIDSIQGSSLEGISYVHPIYKDKFHRFFNAAHVTASIGTGLVHTAPAHGPDDFLVSLRNKIPIVDIVDAKGCYKSEAGPNLNGKSVLLDGGKEIINMIKDNVLHLGEITHSYPYDWRTKQPVIIRASQQWFIDTEALKNEAVEVLADVEIFPKERSEIYRKRLINEIVKRPYWCISRQRKWGVPIPVFYNKNTSEIILNENTVSHHCNLLQTEGTDFWWKLSNRELLPKQLCDTDEEQLAKGEDIMDIWLDSGLSWARVLEGTKVADLYLEGSDQFTGWFQSSLLTSVALRSKAPFKSLYIHGFAVDENGSKMSKSLGNVVDPVEIVAGKKGQKPYGIDVLRWWVACHASQVALANVSTNVMKSCTEEVQKIRSVLRFALGGISDYRSCEEDIEHTLVIDKYILHILYKYNEQVSEYVRDYNFHKIGKLAINLLSNQISALYYTAIKDRLYCDSFDSPSRRAAQYTLWQIFEVITKSIAPMLPHLAEEMYRSLPQRNMKTYFQEDHQISSNDWRSDNLEQVMNDILNCRSDINKMLDTDALLSEITITCSESFINKLKKIGSVSDLENQLVDIFNVSKVTILEDKILEKFKLTVARSLKFKCPRCRRVQADSVKDLCNKCYEVVNLITEKNRLVTK